MSAAWGAAGPKPSLIGYRGAWGQDSLDSDSTPYFQNLWFKLNFSTDESYSDVDSSVTCIVEKWTNILIKAVLLLLLLFFFLLIFFSFVKGPHKLFGIEQGLAHVFPRSVVQEYPEVPQIYFCNGTWVRLWFVLWRLRLRLALEHLRLNSDPRFVDLSTTLSLNKKK